MSASYLAAIAARTADTPTGGDGGDINYADYLKEHLTGALNSVLATQPSDPFRAIQQVLFQASLTGETPAAPRTRAR